MKKACFFDMDGTLIDSRRDLCATVNHTRRDLGIRELPEKEILRNVGLGAKHLLVNSIPEKADDPDGLWEIFRSHYGEHMLDTVELYPTVRETLLRLKDEGWMLGINTAKPAFATKAILGHFGMDGLFADAVVAGGDCDEMKPSAKPLLMCAAKMGLEGVSAGDWMIGDNWTDVECGRNAGVSTAYCDFGFGTLRSSVPRARLARMSDIFAAIANGGGRQSPFMV